MPWQHMQPQQPQMQQPQQQQPPQSPYYGYPPLPPSSPPSSKSRLSYVDPLDPAPTHAPSPPPVPSGPVKYLDDDKAARLQQQTRVWDKQWACFMQGGPLHLPGEPGYEETRVIPQSWIDTTNKACLDELRQEIGQPVPLQPPHQHNLSR